jgi:hypothetical protein
VQFAVIDTVSWIRGEVEPGGDEEKFWLSAPPDGDHAGHWLFKPRRVKSLRLAKARQQLGDKPDILVRGDDWAEKVSCELSRLVAVPAVVTELALAVDRHTNTPINGSMSLDMRPPDWQRSPGAELLSERDVNFNADTYIGHTPEAIYNALHGVKGPPGTPYEAWAAFDVFAGYLAFDAWIANTDRHPLNWAVLQSPTGVVCLAPSFDHGSALGSGMGSLRHARVVDEGVETWCRKGFGRTFEGRRRISLVALAADALEMASGSARRHWAARFSSVEQEQCDDIVAGIPDLSPMTGTFVRELLAINLRRLSDVL